MRVKKRGGHGMTGFNGGMRKKNTSVGLAYFDRRDAG